MKDSNVGLFLDADRLYVCLEFSCKNVALGLVACQNCDREVVGSNLTRGNCTPSQTQRAIPPGSVNE